MQGHWLKRYQLKWNEMHRQSAAKNHHCLSNRFLRTPQNWKQKSSETRSTKNSIWCSHIEPRNLNRKPNSHMVHWTHALEIEMIPKSRKLSINHIIIARQRDSYIHHETGTENHKGWLKESTVKQSDAGRLTQTMLSDVQRNARTFSCKTLPLFVKEIPTDVRKLETKVIRKTRSTANQFDAGTLTEALPTEVERNAQTVSCEKSSLFVKQIPTDTTKLKTKIISDTIHKKN